MDRLLRNAGGLHQHRDRLERRGDLHQEVRGLGVELGQEPVSQVDATFQIDIVGRHVLQTNPVVGARAGTTDRGHDVVAWLELADVWSHGHDLPETLVPENQIVVSWRGGPVLGGVDLLVGAVHPHLEHADQHASPVRHVLRRGRGHVAKMDAVLLARNHHDCFHAYSCFPHAVSARLPLDQLENMTIRVARRDRVVEAQRGLSPFPGGNSRISKV